MSVILKLRGAAASNPEIIAAICGNARMTIQKIDGGGIQFLQAKSTLIYSNYSGAPLRVAEKPRGQDTKNRNCADAADGDAQRRKGHS